MERPDYEIAYIKDFCPASGEVVEKYINSLENALARKRESVNELSEANQRLEAEVERLEKALAKIEAIDSACANDFDESMDSCDVMKMIAKKALEER